jgi:hypothetical protein
MAWTMESTVFSDNGFCDGRNRRPTCHELGRSGSSEAADSHLRDRVRQQLRIDLRWSGLVQIPTVKSPSGRDVPNLDSAFAQNGGYQRGIDHSFSVNGIGELSGSVPGKKTNSAQESPSTLIERQMDSGSQALILVILIGRPVEGPPPVPAHTRRAQQRTVPERTDTFKFKYDRFGAVHEANSEIHLAAYTA